MGYLHHMHKIQSAEEATAIHITIAAFKSLRRWFEKLPLTVSAWAL